MISDRFFSAGSRNASVLFSIRTAKPSSFNQPRIIEAHRSGSCPGQPPHTIIALRIVVIPSIDLSVFASRRHHRRPVGAASDLHTPALVGGDLERFGHFENMECERAAGAMR